MTFSQFPRWTRRQALWMMGGAIASTALHACAQTSPSPSAPATPGAPGAATSPASGPMKASMAITTWIGNTPMIIAQEKGFFEELGLELDIKLFDTVAQAFPAYTAGQLDGIAPVTSEVVSLAARNVDIQVVTVLDTSLGADVILARNSVKNLQDLKGRKIGAERGGIGQFFVLQVLAQAGLTENDVEFVNLTPDAAAAAYQAGSIEVVYTYSPFSDQANAAQKDGRILFSTKEMPTAIADLYCFSSKFIAANPQAVQAFVDGNFKGLEFLQKNPQEGLPIMAKRLNITPAELAEQLKGLQLPDLATNVEMLGNPNSDLSLLKPMNEMARFLKAQGKIDTIPDMAKHLDPTFVKAALAKLG
ncbi:MAG TPA: ABC transporter substrate-binding protein [Synechococcales cyanobacterium M55_K2018_004]|nr:ABC transporter substrate-binding protein [Synechococcales cyanobacterium M55_K2018_004]